MKAEKFLLGSLVVFSLIFSGCGGSSDGSSDSTDTQTGVFLDSAVGGLNYKTPSLSGKTDGNGMFKYKNGESIEFSLGGIKLGSAKAQNVMTPVEIVGGNSVNDWKVEKMLRFLQSLDADENVSNGIVISEDVIDSANSMDLNLSEGPEISRLFALLNVDSQNIVSTVDAKAHFEDTLKERDSVKGTLSNGLVLHMPFTSNAQNISSTNINIEEITTKIEEFTLNMKDNKLNLSYLRELEPRSFTISFWAKIDESSVDGTEVLFALHDGRSDYLTNKNNTTTKYGIQKTTARDINTGENYSTMALYMRLPLVEGWEYHTSYYIQNKSNILESDTWHHFAFTYSPDIDTASAQDIVEWDESKQDYVNVHNEGYKGIARTFHDGKSNVSFIHKTTLDEVDYFLTSDMNETQHKSYNTPTFSFGKFNGSIDDLRIYNRVLSNNEVLGLSKVRK